MLRIAIVEDNNNDRQTLQNYISRYFSSINEIVDVVCFDDGDSFIDEYPSPDMILMDIEMKRMDGLSAARKVREFDDRVMLLFVTNMVNFALEGYSVDAVDFIVKPLSYDSFCARMNRALHKLDSKKDKFIQVTAGRNSIYVNIHDILYAEALNKKTIVHRTDGSELVVTEALYTLESQLFDYGFFRCHSSFLINMERVSTITSTDAIVGSATVPISKHRKKEFLTALANFRGRML